MKHLSVYLWLLLGLCTASAQEPADTAALPETVPATEILPAAEVSNDTFWTEANTAYVNGDFATAIDRYRTIAERGYVSPALHYNLANALFKQGRLGESILHYHRALQLSPGDEDIRYNLAIAEERTKDSIEQVPEFFVTTWLRALRRTMSGNGWTALSLVALAAAAVAVLFYLLASRLWMRKAGFYATVVLAVLFVAATRFALLERREAIDRRGAVVMSSSASVKSSPDGKATDLFVLHEGTTVRITHTLGDWCEVLIADGKKGWIERSRIEII